MVRTWFEVQSREGLGVEEVEGGADGEEHVVVVPFIQNDENQIADLEAETRRRRGDKREVQTKSVIHY